MLGVSLLLIKLETETEVPCAGVHRPTHIRHAAAVLQIEARLRRDAHKGHQDYSVDSEAI